MTRATPTRADYLAGRCTHAEYYRAINEAAGFRYRGHPFTVEQVRAALAAGDEHLNTLPLSGWDAQTQNLRLNGRLSAAMKARGDYLTKAGIVCCWKQAAKDAAQ